MCKYSLKQSGLISAICRVVRTLGSFTPVEPKENSALSIKGSGGRQASLVGAQRKWWGRSLNSGQVDLDSLGYGVPLPHREFKSISCCATGFLFS